MSLQSAILESSREVLREMLAPDLADSLAQRIVERAALRIDEAIGEFLGVELARDAQGKRRGPKPKTVGRAKTSEIFDAPEELETEPPEPFQSPSEAA